MGKGEGRMEKGEWGKGRRQTEETGNQKAKSRGETVSEP